jgi:hypothetical protein
MAGYSRFLDREPERRTADWEEVRPCLNYDGCVGWETGQANRNAETRLQVTEVEEAGRSKP